MSLNAPVNTTQSGGLPRGELLGRYGSYDDAQKLVDHLAAAEDFDIKHLTIVGNDLRSVEHIRTRLSYPRVALAGASQGAMFGAFIGLLIFLFSPDARLLDMAFAVILGMAVWTLIGVLSYTVRKGRRDFASSSQLVASTYDVVCEFSVAGRARQLMGGAGVQPVPVRGPEPAGRPQAAPAEQGRAPQAPPAEGQPSEERRGGYDDLPDGRPRYGVRAPEPEGVPGTEDRAEKPTSEQAEQPTPESADQPADQPDRGPGEDPASGSGGQARPDAEQSERQSP